MKFPKKKLNRKSEHCGYPQEGERTTKKFPHSSTSWASFGASSISTSSGVNSFFTDTSPFLNPPPRALRRRSRHYDESSTILLRPSFRSRLERAPLPQHRYLKVGELCEPRSIRSMFLRPGNAHTTIHRPRCDPQMRRVRAVLDSPSLRAVR